MKKILCAVFAVAVIAVSVVSVSHAHQGATGVVKTRMMAMKDLGELMKKLVKLDWGDVQTARAEMMRVADEVIAHTKEMQKLFPKGSNKKPSAALDSIWEDEAGFAKTISALETAAMTLKNAAPDLQSADGLKPQIKILGAACSACHRDFRQKKN